jgi:hypothetical protein
LEHISLFGLYIEYILDVSIVVATFETVYILGGGGGGRVAVGIRVVWFIQWVFVGREISEVVVSNEHTMVVELCSTPRFTG